MDKYTNPIFKDNINFKLTNWTSFVSKDEYEAAVLEKFDSLNLRQLLPITQVCMFFHSKP